MQDAAELVVRAEARLAAGGRPATPAHAEAQAARDAWAQWEREGKQSPSYWVLVALVIGDRRHRPAFQWFSSPEFIAAYLGGLQRSG